MTDRKITKVCVIRDSQGNLYGLFPDPATAGKAAATAWPDQEPGDDGWDIEFVNDPATMKSLGPKN